MRIVLLDTINCFLDFPQDVNAYLRNIIKYREKDAHMQIAFKLGEWDGFTSLIDAEGYTYQYVIPQVLDELKKVGVDLSKVVIEDCRPATSLPDDLGTVPVDYLKEEIGFDFRDHQHESVNAALRDRVGILHLATNAGKTNICLALTKKLDPYIRTVVVVPSATLAEQTYEEYKKLNNINVGLFSAKVAKKKRPQFMKDHRHIVITTKLFVNMIDLFRDDEFAIMVDETHIFGETLRDVLRYDVPHFPFRIGMTGTIPVDQYKTALIKAHLGGDILSRVKGHELVERGYAVKPVIEMREIVHADADEYFSGLESEGLMEWGIESDYLLTNTDRAQRIIKELETLPDKHTLVLMNASFGAIVADMMGVEFIRDETSIDDRNRLFSQFKRDDGLKHMQLASFGTSSTGISVNEIENLVLVDVGKDQVRILQSIGRVLRLDGVNTQAKVFDWYSGTKYSKRHMTDRKKTYTREKYEFTVSSEKIIV